MMKSSNASAKLQGYIQLLRVKYHVNFLVVLAPVTCYGNWESFIFDYTKIPWAQLGVLAINYVLLSTLMGGVYTINALSDLEDDKAHPVKKFRPIPSGLVSVNEAMTMVTVCFIAAFTGTYYHRGDYKIWPIYTAFILVNLWYSFGFRNTRWRWCIGVTSTLRLALGATIMDIEAIKWYHYIVVFLFMGTLQCLKFRLEKNGCTTNPATPQDSFLELVFVSGVASTIATWILTENNDLFCAFFLFLAFGVFIGFPWVDQHAFPVPFYDSATPPKNVSRFVRISWSLLRYGSLVEFVSFMALCMFVFVPNILLMGIEDLLMPSLTKMDSSRVAFVLGHQRSGTTHLHTTLSRHPNITCTPFLHSFSPSLLLQSVVQYLLKPLLSFTLSFYDSNQHRISVDEILEEHFWLLPMLRTEVISMLFPSIIDSPYFDELFAEEVDVDINDMIFFRRCLARRLRAMSCDDTKLYLARPLGISTSWELLRQVFPESKFLVVVRKPSEAMSSWTQLCAFNIREQSGDMCKSVRLQKYMNRMYKSYSEPMFRSILNLALNPPQNVHIVDFSEWTNHPETTLKSTLKTLGVEQVPARELIPTRGESHQRNPEAAKLIPVAKELVEDYNKYFEEKGLNHVNGAHRPSEKSQ